MLRDQKSHHGLTIDGSLGGTVNSNSLLELDSDGDGDTTTYKTKNVNLSVRCQSNNDGSFY